MRQKNRIALLVSIATLTALFFGYVSSLASGENNKLLTIEIELGREYVDFALTERLAPIIEIDSELRLVKEELISRLTQKRNQIHAELANYNLASLIVLISLILLQFAILLATFYHQQQVFGKYAVNAILTVVFISISVSVLLLF